MSKDLSQEEALQWLKTSPPRTFPPPNGWAWCEPDDSSKPWVLFPISLGSGAAECTEIPETARDGIPMYVVAP